MRRHRESLISATKLLSLSWIEYCSLKALEDACKIAGSSPSLHITAITTSCTKETQTPAYFSVTDEEQTVIDEQFWIRNQAHVSTQHHIVQFNDQNMACSDCSVDVMNAYIACSYACVYGPKSRHNFSEIIEGIVSTTVGESIGVRNGILKYFEEISPEGTRVLVWFCDSQNAVNKFQLLIRCAQNNDFASDAFNFEFATLKLDIGGEEKSMRFLNILQRYHHRLQVEWVKAHCAFPTTIKQHLNFIADRDAKNELRRMHRNFPLILGTTTANRLVTDLMNNPPLLNY